MRPYNIYCRNCKKEMSLFAQEFPNVCPMCKAKGITEGRDDGPPEEIKYGTCSVCACQIKEGTHKCSSCRAESPEE